MGLCSRKGPFDQQVYSKDLHEMFIETGTPEFERAGDKICWKVQLNVNTWFQDPNYQFCGNVEEMISIQQALHLQLTRLASVLEAQTEAKVADEESTKTTGVRFTGEEEVFGDSTWFRRYNALDTSSWSPEIPVDYQKVETPLQRWPRLKIVKSVSAKVLTDRKKSSRYCTQLKSTCYSRKT